MKKHVPFLLFVIIAMAGCSKKMVPEKSAGIKAEAAPVIPESLKEGSRLYTSKCGNCHGLKRTDEYTAAAWLPIMNRMAVKARLSESEKAGILAYVQAYSKK